MPIRCTAINWGSERDEPHDRPPIHHSWSFMARCVASFSRGQHAARRSQSNKHNSLSPSSSQAEFGANGIYHWSNAESEEANCPRQQKPDYLGTAPIPNIIVAVHRRQKIIEPQQQRNTTKIRFALPLALPHLSR